MSQTSSKIVPVILAGGSGTRLWPASRDAFPKQFQPLTGDLSTYQETLRRVADPTLFDHQNWRLCALQALGRREFETLTADRYERDDPLLIEYLLRNILPRRGIEARPSEVLVTMGAQNALWLAATVLLRIPADTLVREGESVETYWL